MEVIFKLITTNGLREVWCLIWVEVGFAWGVDPINFTLKSNLSSVSVWILPFGCRLAVLVEICRLLFFRCTWRMCYLKSCQGWFIILLRSLSVKWYRSRLRGPDILSCRWYGRSAVLKAIREETACSSSIRWVDLGYESTVNEISIPAEGLNGRGISEKKGRHLFRNKRTRLCVLTRWSRHWTWCWNNTRRRQYL